MKLGGAISKVKANIVKGNRTANRKHTKKKMLFTTKGKASSTSCLMAFNCKGGLT